MKNIQCKNCGKGISVKAEACPDCGHPNKKSKHLSGAQELIAVVIAGVFLWGLFEFLGGSSTPSSSPIENMETSHANSQSAVILAGSVMCYERADWDLLVANGVDRNMQQMANLVNSGRCQYFESNANVTFLDNVGKTFALIMMPSGRSGYTLKAALRGK